jgi:hypothetical protein
LKKFQLEKFDPDLQIAATPRQHFIYYKEFGGIAALQLLESLKSDRVETPLFSKEYGFALIYDLLEHGHASEGKKILMFYQSLGKAESDVMREFDYYIRIGSILDEKLLLDDLNGKVAMLQD